MTKIPNLKTPPAALRPGGGFRANRGFLSNGIQKATDELIRTTRYEWRTEGYWSLGCPGGSSGLEKQIAPRPCEPQDMVEVWKFRTITVPVTTPSDGLITQNSAVAMPGVQQNCILKADGVNHEELKNHDEMFRIFNNIFSGNSGYRDDRFPDFFKVPTK